MLKPALTLVLCAIALFSLPLIGQDTDLTLDQIVQKHIDAEGGAAKINAIETMKASGNASLMGGQMEAPITIVTKRPNLMRLDMSVQGKGFIQAFDGTTSWMVNPFMGADPQKANDEDTKAMKEDTDFVGGPLFDYKAKGTAVELMGKEDVEGSSAYKFKVTRKSGTVQYVYVDTQTFLIMKTSGKRKQQGQELDLQTSLGNYKAVNGVMIPFSIEQKNAGQSMMQLTLEKVEVNVPAPESAFQMPETPKETPKPADKKTPEKP